MPDIDIPLSPNFNFSKTCKLTSDHREYDPEYIFQLLTKNKVFHKEYDHTLVSKECRNQFQEVIDSVLPKDDPCHFNVNKLFKEKMPSVIDKATEDKNFLPLSSQKKDKKEND